MQKYHDDPTAYVLTDVETTGLGMEELTPEELDAGATPVFKDKLLEIAVQVVDPLPPFAPQTKVFHRVIKHNRDEVYNLANDYVKEMHTKTGLWDKVEDGTPLSQVDTELVEFLQTVLERRGGRLLGNSIHLDKSFMEAYLPKTIDFLHYRFMDITGFSTYARMRWGVQEFHKELAHTAEDDIRESLAQLAHIDQGIHAHFE